MLSAKHCAALVVLLFAPGTAGHALAATYYVDATAATSSDSGDGSEATPWKTISHAAGAVKAGDTVIVKPGKYDELVTIKESGAKDRLVTFRSEPARKASVKGFVLKGDYICVESFEITSDAKSASGIFAGEAHRKTARTGCRMINNFIHDVTGTAIVSGEQALVKGNLMKNVFRGVFANSGTLVEDNEIDTLVPVMVEKAGERSPQKTQYTFFAGDDITFRGNYLHGTPEKYLKSSMGVCFFGSWDSWIYPASRRTVIENNRCFNATHASEPMGTARKESSHITYRNNLFVNTVYVGVMPKGFTHVTVENNTFINCGAYPIWLQGKQCETAVVRNNLIAYIDRERVVKELDWKAPDAGIRFDTQGPMPVCDHNLIFGTENRKYGPRDMTADPQFIEPAKGDYRLKPGSPAIDAGVTIEAVKADLRQNKRPQGKGPDIGCYEMEPAQTHGEGTR